MTDFEKTLMKRDGIDREEARRMRQEAREEINAMLEDGESYEEIEDMLLCDYGLEMDYIFDLI
jgi:flagellar basal body-associated protein FliL